MRSPFPGMDPYVERRWGTFHSSMNFAFMDALNQSLPPDLEALTEEQVRVEDLAGEQLRGYTPDVTVVDLGEAGAARQPAGGGSAIAEPILLRRRRGPVVSRSILIVDAEGGGRIVTAVELLSPWNKLSGRLNRDYRRTLRDYERGGTNWVEIDLLRSPRTRLTVRWDALQPACRSNYLVVTYRAATDDVGAVPISIRRRLPVIGIPLREHDPLVPLDLQAAFDRAYAAGPFKRIDYSRPTYPPMSADDAAWAAELIANRPADG